MTDDATKIAANLADEAADIIDRMSAALAERDAEIARLRAGGCARDQSTTQFCAEAAALAAEVARLRNPWRPISEAPRDGTDVLLWVGVGMSDPWAQTGQWKIANGWSGWVDTYEGIDLGEPTHWMHLPAPPADTTETPGHG